MRGPYICPDCDQRSTRWWNLKVHMKRKHGGFLLGKSSDGYMANNPPLYKKSVQLGHAMVADTSFQSRYVPQQAPLRRSQHYNGPIYPTWHVTNDRNGLSEDTIVKIEEVKRLMDKYPKYHMNQDAIIQWAIHSCLNGDNTFLDDKLKQLRIIGRRLNG